MLTKLKYWGNSLAVRIPKPLAEEVGLDVDSQVEIEVRKGELIVRPVAKTYQLDELLAQITPDNLHSETDTGPALGNEAW